jgi:hypothetical protein
VSDQVVHLYNQVNCRLSNWNGNAYIRLLCTGKHVYAKRYKRQSGSVHGWEINRVLQTTVGSRITCINCLRAFIPLQNKDNSRFINNMMAVYETEIDKIKKQKLINHNDF